MSDSSGRHIRIAIVGPGAVGSTIAGLLHQSGHSLLLCGRTPRAQLEVRPDSGEPLIVPGPVLTDPEGSRPVDVVILAVKATQLDDVSPWLSALCDDNTVVCALQSGVDQVELVQPHCPSSRVIPVIAWFTAETHAGGWVRLHGEPKLTLPDSAGAVAALLHEAGCIAELVEDFTTPAWRKLLYNAAGGLINLIGWRSGMFCRGDVATVARDYLAECLTIARAEGAQLGDEVIAEVIEQYRERPPDVTASIRTSREAGRLLEWDTINGVVLRKARDHRLPAPISEVVVPLIAAASRGPG